MTPEDKKWVHDRNRSVAEMIRKPFEDDIREAVEAERQRCMADVCEGCREGWPIDRMLSGRAYYHQAPGNCTRHCQATVIRARIEQEKDGG